MSRPSYEQMAAHGPFELLVLATIHVDGTQTQAHWVLDEAELAQVRALLAREPLRQILLGADVARDLDAASTIGVIAL